MPVESTVKSKNPKTSKRATTSRRARAREDANEDEDVRIDVANGSTKRKRPTGEVDSDDDERPFVRRLKELEKRGALDAKKARPSRTALKTNGCRVKKGSLEWFKREKAIDDEALARDAATKERRRG